MSYWMPDKSLQPNVMTSPSPHSFGMLAWVAAGLLTAFSASAQNTREAPETPPLLLSGFGSAGVVRANTDFGGTFARDVSQLPGTAGTRYGPDSRLGAQANWALGERVELVGQVVARDRSADSVAADSVEWAFAAYRPLPGTTFRAGRLSADLYLLSDFRNVGFGYLSARPNVDYYGAMSLNNIDGLDVRHTWQLGDAEWSLKGGLGSARYDILRMRTRLNNAGMLVLSREKDGLTVRGTLARGTLRVRSPELQALRQGLDTLAAVPISSIASEAAQRSAALDFDNLGVKYAALGLAYEKSDWLLQAEWMRITTGTTTLSGTAAYVLAGHRWGAFTPYVGLSRARSLAAAATNPNWGNALAPLSPLIGQGTVAQAQQLGAISTGAINSFRIDQSTRTIGVRWDFRAGMSLKAQWDNVKVSPRGGLLWGGDTGGGRADVGSVVLDFVF